VQVFTVTHPFHPLSGRSFELSGQRQAWGEPRIFFHDPPNPELRSIPVRWTSLAPPDPFLTMAQGRTLLRFLDAQRLSEVLRKVASGQQEED
jgi:Family of unknown function (DUF5372)